MPRAPSDERACRHEVLLAWALALTIAFAAAAAGLLDGPQASIDDLAARTFAPTAPVQGVVLVDIDEPSVEALRPQFGGWPPSRALLARVTAHLLDGGAQAVVIGLVLADPREGDDALAAVIAANPGRVVLAASVRPTQGLGRPGAKAPPGCAAQPWPDLLLPAPSLRAAGPRLGMVSVLPDGDGRLRGWPLWHAGASRALPALPLAALMAAQGLAAEPMSCTQEDPPTLRSQADADLALPLDTRGRLHPRLHREADAVPWRAYEPIARAALAGAPADASLRDQVVVIGASAALGDRAQTAVGPRWGPALLAEMTWALRTGHWLVPPRMPVDAIGWLLACLPALMAWRRGRWRLRADLPWVALAAALIAIGAATSYAGAGQQTRPLAPLLALALFGAVSLLQRRRALHAEARQLEQARAAADAASRVKSEFLAHMSHEIRTPMNALLGSAELLAQTPLDARQRRHVALFQSAGASLLEILNDLLDLSKIEAGLLELHRQPFSPAALVNAQAALFESRAAQKGLRLDTQVDDALPTAVLGDGPRLAQVLRNLLGNAVKFTPTGRVTLAVTRVPGEADRLRFEVRDTGIGVAPHRQHEIFEAFTQADSGVARTYGGTGLGLAISRRLVALMGGRIVLESDEGRGSVFRIDLPLPATDAAPVALWAPAPPAMPAEPRRGLRVLLADDNLQNVELVLAFLEGAGHLVDVVHDGAAAVARFEIHAYDVVLMDVQMPGMDGYRATAALRAIERGRGDAAVPVIALTANAMPDDEARSLAAGCTAHLPKPFSRHRLMQVLASHTRAAPAEDVARRVAPATLEAAPGDASALGALSALGDLDLHVALARLDGDATLYLRLAALARPALACWAERFGQAHAGSDLGLRLRLAHDLKSNAATLGATALAAAAQRLETLLHEPAPTAEAVREALGDIEPRLRRLVHSLGAATAAAEAPSTRSLSDV